MRFKCKNTANKCFAFIVFTAIIVIFNGCHHTCETLNDEDTIKCLRDFPSEDITKYPQVKQHLKEHDNYISLTSSPKRVKKLLTVFKSLDLKYIKEILLVLPKRYGRDNSKYVIPDKIKNFPKVRLIRPPKDLGPITKLVPAAQEIKKRDPDSIIITIDDDIAYHPGAIGQLLKHAILEDAVIGSSGQNVSFWDIPYKNWPHGPEQTKLCGKVSGAACDVIEGFGGVAYKPKYLDIDKLKKLSSKKFSEYCFASDDLVISYVLALNNVPRLKIFNKYISLPIPLSYGFEEDALHRGGGLKEESPQINASKYQKCSKKIAKKNKYL